MNKIITYVENVDDFLIELNHINPDYVFKDETGKIYDSAIQTTPIKKSIKGTLAMCKLTDKELVLANKMRTIKVLGTYDEIFADVELDNIYKSVYPYDKPLIGVDDEGNDYEYYRPRKIGNLQ